MTRLTLVGFTLAGLLALYAVPLTVWALARYREALHYKTEYEAARNAGPVTDTRYRIIKDTAALADLAALRRDALDHAWDDFNSTATLVLAERVTTTTTNRSDGAPVTPRLAEHSRLLWGGWQTSGPLMGGLAYTWPRIVLGVGVSRRPDGLVWGGWRW